MPSYSGVWSLPAVYQAVAQGNWYRTPGIALFGGGSQNNNDATNVISKFDITSGATATDFGDLTTARYTLGSCSSSTRGVWAGGTGPSNVIDYVTIATAGNATDFGDLLAEGSSDWRKISGASNATRGLFFSGDGATEDNVIQYITIATVGNSIDFGDLLANLTSAGACASTTRAVVGGGVGPTPNTNVINYVTIASVGNATDFGDLTVSRERLSACSSSTRGVFGGGSGDNKLNVIDYITIASAGNATDFGDLVVAANNNASTSDSITGIFAGGINSSNATLSTVDGVTIASTGNAIDFGDLNVPLAYNAGCSNSHGGLA